MNEEKTLLSTCQSLGFGVGTNRTPQGATLFLIDNGSTDKSVQIAEDLKSASLEGTVLIGHEPVRGYVPPRSRGNTMAEDSAVSRGIANQQVLIVQADADTLYDDRYLTAMGAAAIEMGPNVLIQACVNHPSDFARSHPKYIELCKELETPFERLFASQDMDVIVDDKASAYWLSDYINWGKHQREYTHHGDEIHSETARLYLRAKATGATRSFVEAATARPSLRKVLEEPSLHFANAGFPREKTWEEKWRSGYRGSTNIDDFSVNTATFETQRAAVAYQQHLVALFVVLPLHVANTLKQILDPHLTQIAALVLPRLPKRTADNLAHSPGVFLTDVFDLIDCWGGELLDAARRIIDQMPRES